MLKTVKDMGVWSASKPCTSVPGTMFNYSSGTTNIVADILGTALCAYYGANSSSPSERKEAFLRFFEEELAAPLGCTSMLRGEGDGGGGGGGGGPKFDQAGTFVGSSFLYATARDFARLPYLYSSSNDGVCGWGGHRRRLLPPGWAAYAHRCTGMDASSGNAYGAHWWVNMFGNGTFSCNGYEGQYAIAAPEEHLVVVRLGKSGDDESSSQKNNVVAQLGALVRELAPIQPGAVGTQAKL